MQTIDHSAQRPKDQVIVRQYNHQTFRPEAVEAYTTRQAGEPWDSKQRFEDLILLLLTLIATAGLTFLALGGQ